MVSLEGAALQLLVDAPMELGAAVKAECHDALMLGEVSQCQPAARQFAVSVTLEHALRQTAELAQLAQILLEGATRAAA